MSSAYEGQVAWPTHRALIEQSHNGLQFILEKVNSNFKYDKLLNNDFFRIFELKPGKDDEPLKGTLRTYLRKEAPRYEALSYVWGSPLLDKHIKCNDRRIKITSSLDLVLKRLRLTSDSRFLWIDQICINQACLEERTEQVCIMRDIYSEAALVNAWLGPADPGDAATVGMMISILAQNRSHVLRDVFPENEKLQELGLPTRDSPAWKTLNSMLNAPYFSRVWIIQELALAATYTLLWGDLVISKADFMSFKRATMNLGMCHPDLRAMASSVGRKGSKGLYPHVKWNYVSMLFTEEFWNMGKDLFDLLSSTKHCYATDPRHKIFALIGLAGDKTFGIRPNYNKTKSVVFTEFALNVISETRNLKVLNYSDVEDPNDEERLPLWAPRWHHEATPGYCDMSLFGFKSSNGLEINLESSINTQVLQLNGLYVDQVKESYAQDIKPDLNCMAIGSMVTNQRRLLEHQYGLDMIRAIALTMIKGRTLPLYADTECKRPTDDSYLNAFTAFAFRSFVASFVKIDDGEMPESNTSADQDGDRCSSPNVTK